jgi:hypothetical protein
MMRDDIHLMRPEVSDWLASVTTASDDDLEAMSRITFDYDPTRIVPEGGPIHPDIQGALQSEEILERTPTPAPALPSQDVLEHTLAVRRAERQPRVNRVFKHLGQVGAPANKSDRQYEEFGLRRLFAVGGIAVLALLGANGAKLIKGNSEPLDYTKLVQECINQKTSHTNVINEDPGSGRPLISQDLISAAAQCRLEVRAVMGNQEG